MKIKFLNLQKQYKTIKNEVDSAIHGVLNSQMFLLGEKLLNFEKEFSNYLGVKYSVGVNSGTDGLILALRALNISPGDEIITPVNSFMATTLAITTLGATPIFVDCDPDTFQIQVKDIEKKINVKTKAILPVHLYGAPCNIKEIRYIAKKRKLFLIEDAAQAHGASVNGRKVGTYGDISVFSFYPGKNLGAYGDGGMIVTSNRGFYERLLRLRNYGQTKKYLHQEIGFNSRLDEIQAAVLSVKLKHLNSWNTKRNHIANVYKSKLITKYQKVGEKDYSCYHLFAIISKNREELMTSLDRKGIQTLIHYPLPLHLQPCFSYLGYKQGDFPVAERLAQSIVSLPVYPELSERELQYIITCVNHLERII